MHNILPLFVVLGVISIACARDGGQGARTSSDYAPEVLHRLQQKTHKLSLLLHHHTDGASEGLSMILEAPDAPRQEGFPGATTIQINSEQAKRLLAALSRDGFLSDALSMPWLARAPRRPYYFIRLVIDGDDYATIELLDRKLLERLYMIMAALRDSEEAAAAIQPILSLVQSQIEILYYGRASHASGIGGATGSPHQTLE